MNWRLPKFFVLAILGALAAAIVLLSRTEEMAHHRSLITELGYLRSVESAGIEQISRETFLPVGSGFSGGYDPAAHWFRMRIRPPANGGPVILGLYPAFLDHVTLFSSEGGGRWRKQESGDSVPMAARSWQGAGLGFRVEPREEGSVYYLRLRTESTAQVFLNARALRNELVHDSQRMALHAMLFAIIWVALILALLQALYRPSLVDALLVASTAIYMVYSVFLLGYAIAAHPGWPPHRIARITDILYFVTVASNVGFHRAFLARMNPARWSLRFSDLLILGSGLALVAYLLGFESQSYQANSVVVLLTAFAFVAMAWSARENGDPPLRLVHLLYAAFAVTSAAWMLLNLGIIPAIGLLRYSVEVQGLMNVLLVLSLAISRAWSRQRKLASQKARMRDAELRRSIAARSADLKDKLLNMLAHEVRNHLATIRMSAETAFDATDRQHILSITRDLDMTITDCIRLAWLERGDLVPKAGHADLLTTVLEVLAEVDDDDRIDLVHGDPQAALPSDGEMLRIALFTILREIDALARPGARILIELDQDSPAPDERWRIRIAAARLSAGDPRRAIEWSPESGDPPDRSSLSLAIGKGMIELIGGSLELSYAQESIECRMSLPANSMSL